jgi:hypothetical protein
MSNGEFTLSAELQEGGADEERLDELTRMVLSELRREGVGVARATAPTVPETKSAVGIPLATLVITGATSPVLVQALGILRDWLRRHERRTIVLTIDDQVVTLTGDVSDTDLTVSINRVVARRDSLSG